MENMETNNQITIKLKNDPLFIVKTSTNEHMCRDLNQYMQCADQVKGIYISGDSHFNIEDLKVFLNLEQLNNSTGILTHDELCKIQQFFPHLKVLKYRFVDEEIFIDYYNDNSINFEIITSDTKFSINDSDNPFFSNVKNSLFKNSKFNLKKIDFVEIKINIPQEEKYLKELYQYTQEIETLQFDYTSFNDIISFVNMLKSKNIKINTIYIKCENKTYPEINALKNACQGCEVKIDYSPNLGEYSGAYIFNLQESCTIDEFIEMRATIDYYLDLIKSYALSPFEQTIFVYDIIKSLKYDEDKSNTNNSRYLHNIVKTGKIVCYGYTTFVVQLLTELGISANECSIYCSNSFQEDYHSIHPEQIDLNHSRTLVKLDDNKYNIHGLFCEDPTFDSSPKDSINLYNYFLLSYNEYTEIFPRDTLPELFYFYLYNIYHQETYVLDSNFIVKNFSYYGMQMLTALFGLNPDSRLISKYIECPPISIEKFANALRVVRKCEGYPEEAIEEEINKARYHLIRIISDINRINK